MTGFIEPNAHPIIVHFVIAFLLTSPLLLLVAAFAPAEARWRSSAQAAGDWMLALGVVAAVLAVAAGLQAYYTVAHDGPSHAAMTDHRNFGFATVALFAVFAVWRYTTRSSTPSKLFGVFFLAAAFLLATTAWKGGRLVYHHGLGVESLPAAEGEGRHHDHGDGHEHGEASSIAKDADAEAHVHDEHEHGAEDAPDETASAAMDYSSLGPTDVADAFQQALADGDKTALRALLAPDVVIAEGGGVERSLEEYAGHHMPADMAFTSAVEATIKKRDVLIGDALTTVITESQLHGTFNRKTIHSRMMETMALRRMEDGWKIAHIHWSSTPILEEHEH